MAGRWALHRRANPLYVACAEELLVITADGQLLESPAPAAGCRCRHGHRPDRWRCCAAGRWYLVAGGHGSDGFRRARPGVHRSASWLSAAARCNSGRYPRAGAVGQLRLLFGCAQRPCVRAPGRAVDGCCWFAAGNPRPERIAMWWLHRRRALSAPVADIGDVIHLFTGRVLCAPGFHRPAACRQSGPVPWASPCSTGPAAGRTRRVRRYASVPMPAGIPRL